MAEGRVHTEITFVEPPLDVLMALERGDVAQFNHWLVRERARPENMNKNIGARIDRLMLDGSVDLSGVDLSYAQIACMELNGTRLRNAILDHAVIGGSFEHVDATGSSFRNTYLDIDISDSIFDRAIFHHAQFGGDAQIQNSITRSSFQNAQFDYTLFSHISSIEDSNFSHALFENSAFCSLRFNNTRFDEAVFGPYVAFDLPQSHFDTATFESNPLIAERYREYHESAVTAERVPELPSNTSFSQILRTLYLENRGIVMGEYHQQLAHGEFLRAQMPELVRQNVGVIFLEGFTPEDSQLLFDRFNEGAAGSERALFDHMATNLRLDFNPSYHESVMATMLRARELGIRFEPMEDTRETGRSPDYIRLRDSNRTWAEIVTRRLAELEAAGLISANTRYLVYGGAAHTRNAVIDRGVDAILGIPSIDLGTVIGNERMRIEVQRDNDRVNADVIVSLRESSAQDTGYAITQDSEYLSPHRITNFQKDLNVLGYHVEETGQFDATTIAAVRQFQQENNLRATGDADERTLEYFNVAFAEAYLERLGYGATPPLERPNGQADAYTQRAIEGYYHGQPPSILVSEEGTISYRMINDFRDALSQSQQLADAVNTLIPPMQLGNLPSLPVSFGVDSSLPANRAH